MAGYDLHVHTNRSDGTFTPKEAVDLAVERGLTGIAITDHDTLAGLDEAASAAGDRIEIVPGIEFSAEYEGASLHVLAYWIDPANEALRTELTRLTDTRFRRGELMVEKLQELGYPIDFDRVREIAGVGEPGQLGPQSLVRGVDPIREDVEVCPLVLGGELDAGHDLDPVTRRRCCLHPARPACVIRDRDPGQPAFQACRPLPSA